MNADGSAFPCAACPGWPVSQLTLPPTRPGTAGAHGTVATLDRHPAAVAGSAFGPGLLH